MGKACFFSIYYYAGKLQRLRERIENVESSRTMIINSAKGSGDVVSSTSYEHILIETLPEIVTWR